LQYFELFAILIAQFVNIAITLPLIAKYRKLCVSLQYFDLLATLLAKICIITFTLVNGLRRFAILRVFAISLAELCNFAFCIASRNYFAPCFFKFQIIALP